MSKIKYIFLSFVILGICVIGGQAQLKPTPVYYFNPSWSPDGKQIVFESTKEGKSAIYIIRVGDSNLLKLTNGAADDAQPRWSKNGRQIVFISNRDGHSHVYIMNADGSGQRRITNGPDQDFIPELSPKGNQVVFVSNSITYLIHTDGTGKTKLPDGGEDPRWSPNGKNILFTKTDSISKAVSDDMPKMSREERLKVIAKRDSSSEIFVMNKDGSKVRKLTNNKVRDFSPEWSKNGKTIYFLSERDPSVHVYAMKSDGSNVRKVADGNVVKGTSISPDEKFFVYTKQLDGKYGIYIYEIKSGKETLLIGG